MESNKMTVHPNSLKNLDRSGRHPNSLKNLDRTGVKFSEDHKRKLSESHSKETELEAIVSGRIINRTKWWDFRKIILKRDKYICFRCKKKAESIHHIKNRKEFPELCFVQNNVISICRSCHVTIEPRGRSGMKKG